MEIIVRFHSQVKIFFLMLTIFNSENGCLSLIELCILRD